MAHHLCVCRDALPAHLRRTRVRLRRRILAHHLVRCHQLLLLHCRRLHAISRYRRYRRHSTTNRVVCRAPTAKCAACTRQPASPRSPNRFSSCLMLHSVCLCTCLSISACTFLYKWLCICLSMCPCTSRFAMHVSDHLLCLPRGARHWWKPATDAEMTGNVVFNRNTADFASCTTSVSSKDARLPFGAGLG